jgi:hypothetical protein
MTRAAVSRSIPRHDAATSCAAGQGGGGIVPRHHRGKAVPTVARYRHDWGGVVDGGWSGSEKLSWLDIPTVACITTKANAGELLEVSIGGGLTVATVRFLSDGHNDGMVIFELVNRYALNMTPSGCRIVGRTATANLPGVSSPIFVFIPVARSNLGVWRRCRSFGKSQYRLMPRGSRCGSTTQTKPDAPPGTAVTGKTVG